MSKKKELTDLESIELAKNDGVDMGRQSKLAFDKNKNSRSLRDANISYRLALQAIRDKARYKIV